MNFAVSESNWYNVYDPEVEHHEELFNGDDMQCHWHETDNNELQNDRIKNRITAVKSYFIDCHPNFL